MAEGLRAWIAEIHLAQTGMDAIGSNQHLRAAL
jgi:hypothetical protein